MIVYLIYLTETGHSILLIIDLGSHLAFSETDIGEVSVTKIVLDNAATGVLVPVCGGIGV